MFFFRPLISRLGVGIHTGSFVTEVLQICVVYFLLCNVAIWGLHAPGWGLPKSVSKCPRFVRDSGVCAAGRSYLFSGRTRFAQLRNLLQTLYALPFVGRLPLGKWVPLHYLEVLDRYSFHTFTAP